MKAEFSVSRTDIVDLLLLDNYDYSQTAAAVVGGLLQGCVTSRTGPLSSLVLIHKPRHHFYFGCPCFGACLGGSNFPNSINS